MSRSTQELGSPSSSACCKDEFASQRFPPVGRGLRVLSLFLLLSHRGSVSSSIFFFFPECRKKKSLYSHNKNKSVLYFTIYFKYFHYEALMSPPRLRSRQHSPKTQGARGTIRRHTWNNHTSPPSRPHPQTKTHQCIRKSISAACSSEVRSTALPHTHLCIPTGTPSWLSGKRHSPAAFGNNLVSAPLDKRFLGHSRLRCIHCCIHSRAAPVPRACSSHACT